MGLNTSLPLSVDQSLHSPKLPMPITPPNSPQQAMPITPSNSPQQAMPITPSNSLQQAMPITPPHAPRAITPPQQAMPITPPNSPQAITSKNSSVDAPSNKQRQLFERELALRAREDHLTEREEALRQEAHAWNRDKFSNKLKLKTWRRRIKTAPCLEE